MPGSGGCGGGSVGFLKAFFFFLDFSFLEENLKLKPNILFNS